MERFDREISRITKRLQTARQRLLLRHPFYGVLLMHMKFVLDKSCETSYTDGARVGFHPEYLSKLSNDELEFVLMHEVLHTALGHPFRVQADYDLAVFDQACDIVVNSNILDSFGGDMKRIILKNFGESMHLAPNGKEGRKYTVEQVYEMLMKAAGKTPKKEKGKGQGGDGSKDDDKGKGESQGDGTSDSGKEGKGQDTPASLEELIASIKARSSAIAQSLKQESMADMQQKNTSQQAPIQLDDHSFWEGDDADGSQKDTWNERVIETSEIVSSMGGNSRGTVPLAAQRLMEELKNPILDWRTILCDFVQEEVCDYSFAPPDKRMEDSPFFLPDFNEKDESAKNLLFMIDTSGSMSDEAITECYSEIYGAIQQFGGKLTGKLGFFDAVVVEPVPFEDEEEFKIIRPKGGGGTSFHVIFDYVREHMQEDPPVSIIILTDGYAPFPDQKDAMDIPVLWIINNTAVNPPWGKTARMVPENTTE